MDTNEIPTAENKI